MSIKPKKNQFFQGGPRSLFIGLAFIMFSILILSLLTDYTRQVRKISYSTFLSDVEANRVKAVEISGQAVRGILKDNTPFETVIANTAGAFDLLRAHHVETIVDNPASHMTLWYISFFIAILAAVLFIAWLLLRQAKNTGGSGGSSIFSVGTSRARMFMPSTIKETFDSVAGATEAKEELKDLIDFLKYPEKFRRLGAKVTRGVLLVGEPGNGKTLLAKAVAGEANCPFFSISGSDFIEVFVGVGAARVRDLFKQARKHAPCIIFIDEIDAVGRHRGSGLGGGHDEREQTLNQLLTEMDGFQTSGGSVIVLAATNRPDVLDKALLRPGRFDRRVEVPFPDLFSREQILRLHAKGIKIDAEVDINRIARGTPGFSGADLANLVNEAAILASKLNDDTVKIKHFEEARDKIMLGKELKTIILTPHDRKLTAYHEAGHTLMGLLIPEHTDPLHKVTIIPRGRALGITHSLPERDKYTKTREEMVAHIKVCLGGRAAEEIAFDTSTTGAYSDFIAATDVARNMVCYYGMSDLGPVVYRQQPNDFVYSQHTAQRIDTQVHDLLTSCYDEVKKTLTANRDKLDLLALTLFERETMFAGEIYELLGITPRQEHRF